MKYIVLVGDGMGDRPIEELGNKTPLEVARVPNMNYIASNGKVGLTSMIPKRLSPASDVANLSILGYDPKKYYSGRGPLEAANIGINVEDDDIVFRCNLVTVADDKMIDYSAGHISSEEAQPIIDTLNKKLGDKGVKFYAGVSYRHLAMFKEKDREKLNRFAKLKCTPPHDISGKNISKYLPKKSGEGDFINSLMDLSKEALMNHEINKVRIDLGENQANMIWLWGQGLRPAMPRFDELYGVTGSIISAVDLIKGIGRIIGLEVLNVPGATGYYDTNYAGKGQAALSSLKKKDFVFVHVEAPDEAGHNGDLKEKIKAIENFDKFVVGAILDHFKASGEDYRILVTSDHATPLSLKTHSRDLVCFAMCGTDIEKDELEYFNEKEAQKSKFRFDKGHELMSFFIK